MPRYRRHNFFLLALLPAIFLWPLLTNALNIPAPDPVIKIPGLSDLSQIEEQPCPDLEASIGASGCLYIPWIGEYVGGLYKFAVLASTILATVVLMAAGFIWLTAGGNVSQIGTARSYIGGAIMGLVLMLGSYPILNLINPDLVVFKSLRIPVIPKIPIQEKILNAAKYCRWGQAVIDPANLVTRCDWGGITTGVEKCPEQKTSEDQVCCCQPVAYQSGIEAQKTDAKKELAELIDCISKYDEIIISSISDSNIAGGDCEPWNPNETFGSKTNCQHSRGSAHYGGPSGISSAGDNAFSCAVDIKPKDGNYEKLYDIATRSQYCNASFAQCENRGSKVICASSGNPDHVHVSVGGCGSQ